MEKSYIIFLGLLLMREDKMKKDSLVRLQLLVEIVKEL